MTHGASVRRGSPTGDELETILHHWRDVAPDDRMAHLVKDAMRAFDRSLQSRLAVHGVPLGHWTFLRVLWQTDGLTQRELSREVGVMEPTTFAALKSMVARGLVVRRRLAGNRRKMHVFLTPRGRALERKLVPLAVEVNRLAVEGVRRAEIAATRRTLRAVLENLARDGARTTGDAL